MRNKNSTMSARFRGSSVLCVQVQPVARRGSLSKTGILNRDLFTRSAIVCGRRTALFDFVSILFLLLAYIIPGDKDEKELWRCQTQIK